VPQMSSYTDIDYQVRDDGRLLRSMLVGLIMRLLQIDVEIESIELRRVRWIAEDSLFASTEIERSTRAWATLAAEIGAIRGALTRKGYKLH